MEFDVFTALLATNEVHIVSSFILREESILFPCSGEVHVNGLQIVIICSFNLAVRFNTDAHLL